VKIGPFEHPGKVIVAPMAGVTDQPFRNLCRLNGAYWVVSEMLTSDQRLWQTAKSSHRLRFATEPEPRWVQIAGADPDMLAAAARANVAAGAQIIDINMGCPAKKVCNRAAGSALMRDEKRVAKILDGVVRAVEVPVTLKIRLGWSLQEKNAVAIAKIAETAGVQLITVHGRSRACKFKGRVDYTAIGEVVDAVSVPVIANGDIQTEQQAASVLALTSAAGVMIGRAVQGQPWLPDQIDAYLQTGITKKSPSASEIKTLLSTHIVNLSEFYGEVMGPRIARKHVGWYFRKLSDDRQSRGFLRSFNDLEDTAAQVRAIDGVFATMPVVGRDDRGMAA